MFQLLLGLYIILIFLLQNLKTTHDLHFLIYSYLLDALSLYRICECNLLRTTYIPGTYQMLLYIHSNILNHFEGSFFCCCSMSLLLAALSLHCSTQAFSSCGKHRLPFIALHRLLAGVASLVGEQGLWGTWAQ